MLIISKHLSCPVVCCRVRRVHNDQPILLTNGRIITSRNTVRMCEWDCGTEYETMKIVASYVLHCRSTYAKIINNFFHRDGAVMKLCQNTVSWQLAITCDQCYSSSITIKITSSLLTSQCFNFVCLIFAFPASASFDLFIDDGLYS